MGLTRDKLRMGQGAKPVKLIWGRKDTGRVCATMEVAG